MENYSVVVFYPDGTKWEGRPYSTSQLAWCVLRDIIRENHSVRGYVYNCTTNKRIATYGMPLDE